MADETKRRRRVRAMLGTRRRRGLRVRPGAMPGTLVGADSAQAPVLSVIAFTRETVTERSDVTIDEALALVAPAGLTWINVDGLADPAVLTRLGERFGLHPLALEDVLNVGQRPKVERYDKHLFVVMRTVRVDAPVTEGRETRHGEIVEEQVSLFLGPDWIVTVQERSGGDCFTGVREAVRKGRGRVREAGADYLGYLLLDGVVDAYFPVIEELSDRMEHVESEALADPSADVLIRLQRLRHDLLAMRRAVWPMREEMAILQREETPVFTPETRVFLRDVYDHTVQALEIVESLRETATSVMEIYLSVQNQRLNEVMKVLTVIATLFIPLTFIASIYGMNFEAMPELRWRYGYGWALGLMALTAAGLVAFFKKRGWW
ncbi:MAG TPA: magnesium/cobalt transporter CorA [Candidatus Limnocylindria bacterium]|nr:magnesium/cobalt transporter CorA [Candidatus Limnocylindria bacterium]